MIELLNQHDLKNNDLFSNLQGNILKGHGRDFTTNIFIKFDAVRKEKVTEWITAFANDKITSCKKQLQENELFKRNKVSGDVFYSFLLTALGYKYLEKSTDKFEATFVNGMENAGLHDPEKKLWEEGFKGELHAMILIGDDNQEKLATATREIVTELDLLGVVTTIEYGNVLKNENKDGIEHFGYVDGISQPLFFVDELKKFNELNGSSNIFDPSAPKELILLKDPLVDEKKFKDAYGSYFVFRKLEQNVRKFKRDEQKLADQLKLEGEDSERAGAMIIGRFEDGTPVQVSDEAGMIGSGVFNNFDYSNGADKVGNDSKCPYHAHIRKSNPRADIDNRTDHRNRIMARRGIPYGPIAEFKDLEKDFHNLPEEGVGLLFMSFQNSISKQFEVIQKNWVNEPNFPKKDSGIDPVIGQDGASNVSIGRFPDSSKPTSFESAVNLKGGEYFFAPSIPFLKSLKPKKKCEE